MASMNDRVERDAARTLPIDTGHFMSAGVVDVGAAMRRLGESFVTASDAIEVFRWRLLVSLMTSPPPPVPFKRNTHRYTRNRRRR